MDAEARMFDSRACYWVTVDYPQVELNMSPNSPLRPSLDAAAEMLEGADEKFKCGDLQGAFFLYRQYRMFLEDRVAAHTDFPLYSESVLADWRSERARVTRLCGKLRDVLGKIYSGQSQADLIKVTSVLDTHTYEMNVRILSEFTEAYGGTRQRDRGRKYCADRWC